jgi:hypothetical protein
MADKCALHEVSRPDVKDVHKVLNLWGGIVVHFSGVPAGVSSGLNLQFPDDLKHVLTGNAQGGISCSTVRPGDTFEDPVNNQRNSWGCIGVIVRSRDPWSLVCVHPHDDGSHVGLDGLRVCSQIDSDLTLEDVVRSLEDRSVVDCNEWVMRDYDVLGVLFQPPFTVSTRMQFATPREMAAAVFVEWPWFTITREGIYQLTSDFRFGRKLEAGELYPVS